MASDFSVAWQCLSKKTISSKGFSAQKRLRGINLNEFKSNFSYSLTPEVGQVVVRQVGVGHLQGGQAEQV
jgi:hypothetical protein